MKHTFNILGFIILCLIAVFDNSPHTDSYPHTNNWQYHFDQGEFFLTQLKTHQAIRHFSYAIVLNPNHAPSYLYRGVVYDMNSENEHALADYHMAIAIDSQWSPPYWRVCQDYYWEHQLEKALEYCQNAVLYDPNTALYFKSRGEIHHALGNTDAACSDFKQAQNLHNTITLPSTLTCD